MPELPTQVSSPALQRWAHPGHSHLVALRLLAPVVLPVLIVAPLAMAEVVDQAREPAPALGSHARHDRFLSVSKKGVGMTTEIWLWLALSIITLLYIWVGRVLVSQPPDNRPPIFYSDAAAAAGMAAPLIGYVAVTAAGFLFTEAGWFYLGAAVLAYWIFAVKPRFM
jgi:hypothetical protein